MTNPTIPPDKLRALVKALNVLGHSYSHTVGQSLEALGNDRHLCVVSDAPIAVATLTVIGQREVDRLMEFAQKDGDILVDSRTMDKRGVN